MAKLNSQTYVRKEHIPMPWLRLQELRTHPDRMASSTIVGVDVCRVRKAFGDLDERLLPFVLLHAIRLAYSSRRWL